MGTDGVFASYLPSVCVAAGTVVVCEEVKITHFCPVYPQCLFFQEKLLSVPVVKIALATKCMCVCV